MDVRLNVLLDYGIILPYVTPLIKNNIKKYLLIVILYLRMNEQRFQDCRRPLNDRVTSSHVVARGNFDPSTSKICFRILKSPTSKSLTRKRLQRRSLLSQVPAIV